MCSKVSTIPEPGHQPEFRPGPRRETEGSLVAEEYLWGTEPLPERARECELDLVVACDCVYDEHLGEPLLQSLERLAGPKTVVRVWKPP